MTLILNHQDPALKVVYALSRELQENPEHVKTVQALSLDNDKPFLGLKPIHGLFGSDEWWESIRSGRIRTIHKSGIIRELVFAGQDSRWGAAVNSFDLELDGGTVVLESIYAHQKRDHKLFRVGASVSCWYALLELKRQPARDGSIDYAETLLEMAVSV